MTAILSLTGYDRKTDRRVTEFEIPDAKSRKVIRNIGFDPAVSAGDVKLTSNQAELVADILGVEIDTKKAEFFLEVSAVSAG